MAKEIKSAILSTRVFPQFFEETNSAATLAGKKRGDFIEEAVREKIERVLNSGCGCGGKCESQPFTPADLDRVTNQRIAVKKLMADGKWRTVLDITATLGYTPVSIPAIGARLRDLRKARYGAYTVNRRKVGIGLFEFQLVGRAA
jgi:hypothetical protein